MYYRIKLASKTNKQTQNKEPTKFSLVFCPFQILDFTSIVGEGHEESHLFYFKI